MQKKTNVQKMVKQTTLLNAHKNYERLNDIISVKLENNKTNDYLQLLKQMKFMKKKIK